MRWTSQAVLSEGCGGGPAGGHGRHRRRGHRRSPLLGRHGAVAGRGRPPGPEQQRVDRPERETEGSGDLGGAAARQLLIDFLGYGYSDRPAGFGYTLEDHARTIVALIDDLALGECCLIGHSMGGGVGILVASARPHIVSLLIMAEGHLGLDEDGPDGPDPIAARSEQDFVKRGFADLLDGQTRDAEAQPKGLRAAVVAVEAIG